MKFELNELLSKLPLPATETWPEGVWDVEAFAHGSMSSILFAPRGKDYQTTHTQDEMYFVHRGQGVLLIEEERFPFVAGDALFVPANKVHRFVEFSEDFVTWAIFWGPAGRGSDRELKRLDAMRWEMLRRHVVRVVAHRSGGGGLTALIASLLHVAGIAFARPVSSAAEAGFVGVLDVTAEAVTYRSCLQRASWKPAASKRDVRHSIVS
jgi:mannose-6-phosphate isomerase-like protein (cupin superfamily)